MEKYIDKLFDEYKEAKNKERFKFSDFDIWLDEKQQILKYYEQFLETMDFIPRRGVIELNKSKYDSVLPYTPMDTLGLLVSENNKGLDVGKKKIIGIDGKIVVDKNIELEYSKKKRTLDFINFYITQFPTDQQTIDLLANIALKNKHIFIGTYGNLNDKDYELKLRKLYDLKQELQIYLGKNIEGEVVKTSNYYMTAITPKYKCKKK